VFEAVLSDTLITTNLHELKVRYSVCARSVMLFDTTTTMLLELAAPIVETTGNPPMIGVIATVPPVVPKLWRYR
jgi:hypothetical protein